MSTLRFPRTRIVRDLIRLENELSAWKDEFEQRVRDSTLSGQQVDRLEEKIDQVEGLRQRVHSAADFASMIAPRGWEIIRDVREQRARRLG